MIRALTTRNAGNTLAGTFFVRKRDAHTFTHTQKKGLGSGEKLGLGVLYAVDTHTHHDAHAEINRIVSRVRFFLPLSLHVAQTPTRSLQPPPTTQIVRKNCFKDARKARTLEGVCLPNGSVV